MPPAAATTIEPLSSGCALPLGAKERPSPYGAGSCDQPTILCLFRRNQSTLAVFRLRKALPRTWRKLRFEELLQVGWAFSATGYTRAIRPTAHATACVCVCHVQTPRSPHGEIGLLRFKRLLAWLHPPLEGRRSFSAEPAGSRSVSRDLSTVPVRRASISFKGRDAC